MATNAMFGQWRTPSKRRATTTPRYSMNDPAYLEEQERLRREQEMNAMLAGQAQTQPGYSGPVQQVAPLKPSEVGPRRGPGRLTPAQQERQRASYATTREAKDVESEYMRIRKEHYAPIVDERNAQKQKQRVARNQQIMTRAGVPADQLDDMGRPITPAAARALADAGIGVATIQMAPGAERITVAGHAMARTAEENQALGASAGQRARETARNVRAKGRVGTQMVDELTGKPMPAEATRGLVAGEAGLLGIQPRTLYRRGSQEMAGQIEREGLANAERIAATPGYQRDVKPGEKPISSTVSGPVPEPNLQKQQLVTERSRALGKRRTGFSMSATKEKQQEVGRLDQRIAQIPTGQRPTVAMGGEMTTPQGETQDERLLRMDAQQRRAGSRVAAEYDPALRPRSIPAATNVQRQEWRKQAEGRVAGRRPAPIPVGMITPQTRNGQAAPATSAEPPIRTVPSAAARDVIPNVVANDPAILNKAPDEQGAVYADKMWPTLEPRFMAGKLTVDQAIKEMIPEIAKQFPGIADDALTQLMEGLQRQLEQHYAKSREAISEKGLKDRYMMRIPAGRMG